MKLLFDQNLASALVSRLASVYPGSEHVRESGMHAASDNDIWNYARQNEMMIVSKDSDFYYRSMVLGHLPKVVWVFGTFS
jgi:predicted nuclease of predicted toxin-antitoxin system